MNTTRGLFRGLFSSLLDDEDYQRLSSPARLVLLTVRLCPQSGPASIFRYYRATIAAQTGLSEKTVERALETLESGRWIAREGVILWIRNGLRYDPWMRLADPKHRKSVERSLAALPRKQIVLTFCEYYGITRPFDGPSQSTEDLESFGSPRPSPSPSPSPSPRRSKSRTRTPAPMGPERNGAPASARVETPLAARPESGWVALLDFPRIDWPWIMNNFPGLDHEAVARDAVAYWHDHPGKYRDPKAFMRNQFSRAFQRHRDQARAGDPYADLPCAWECPTCGGVHEGPRDGPRPACSAAPR